MIKERLLKYLDFKGVTRYKFYKDTGLSNGFLDKEGAIGSDKCEKICYQYSDINPTWLLTGKGEMIQNKIEVEGSTSGRLLEKQGKPLIPLDALAGNGVGGFTIMEHDIKEYYNVPEFNHADFMIKVSGASMQPKYYGGDVVACKTVTDWTFFQWNRVYVLDTAQGAIIKRVKQGSDDNHLLLVSENKNYEPFEIAKADLNGLALVIGVIRLE